MKPCIGSPETQAPKTFLLKNKYRQWFLRIRTCLAPIFRLEDGLTSVNDTFDYQLVQLTICDWFNLPTNIRGVGDPLGPEVESKVTHAIPTGSE